MAKKAQTAKADQALILVQRRAYMTLSLDERRRLLAAQAERMAAHYEQDAERAEREAWQGR
jgi:hypothetical protein